MSVRVLYHGEPGRFERYAAAIRPALAEAGVAAEFLAECAAPETVDYIVYAPTGAIQDFRPFTRLKAVLSLWAGVEKIVDNATLQVPLCRMVDPGLTEGMVEWVTGHTLRHHLGMDAHILGQDGEWRGTVYPPLARERQVAFLGLGALGQACAQAAVALNFKVSGWSRTEKQVAGVECYHGDEGLQAILGTAEIAVLLLPNTPSTRDILNAQTLAQLPKGAVIINPGRGALIDEDALLVALDSGHIAHATLDVFKSEPLPPSHPFWPHPRVTVTPHIAATTRPETCAPVIAENIRRGETGLPFLHTVNRQQGY